MSAKEFEFQILQLFYQDVHRLEQNNYDAYRFSYDGVDRSQIFDVATHAKNLAWFASNHEALFRTYSRLVDQQSRDLYVNLLRFKLAGHLHVRIKNHIAALAGEVAQFKAAFTGSPSTVSVSGMFGTLVHYDNEWNGAHYTADALQDSLISTLIYRQYFFERNGIRIAPERGDHVIDGGACLGDTMVVFSKAVGTSGHVYSFDPVQVHIDTCNLNASRPGYENTTIFPYGVSGENIDAPMVQSVEYQPGYHPMSTDSPIPMRRIDDLVMGGGIKKIDFIKLDVEGSELAALRGAVSSLHRFRPKLAISIYHRPNDFFELCDFVHDLGLGYSFYLDHYTIHGEETVLYAAAK